MAALASAIAAGPVPSCNWIHLDGNPGSAAAVKAADWRLQGWTERSVGFLRDQISLQDRALTAVAPSSLIRYVVPRAELKLSSRNINILRNEWWLWIIDHKHGDCAERLLENGPNISSISKKSAGNTQI